MRSLITALATLWIAVTPALADNTSGTVVAFDRVAKVLVLDDKTVWYIVPADLAVPDDLVAGDKIAIEYVSNGDSGVGKIVSITRVEG